MGSRTRLPARHPEPRDRPCLSAASPWPRWCCCPPPAPRGRRAATPARPPRTPRDVLTYDQLAATQLPTLYEAVQRLQPSWLRTPAGSPLQREIGVFLNGARVGGLEFLRQFPPTQAEQVRYMNSQAMEAELAAFQIRGLGAAIMISGRRPERGARREHPPRLDEVEAEIAGWRSDGLGASIPLTGRRPQWYQTRIKDYTGISA